MVFYSRQTSNQQKRLMDKLGYKKIDCYLDKLDIRRQCLQLVLHSTIFIS
jgi:hypothetical protein